MTVRFVIAFVACLSLLAPRSIAQEPTQALSTEASKLDPQADAKAKKIEVVFVLDTTGSMGGLINAAKEKIWAIANTLSSAKSAPTIRIGLVAYRDRGDDYVTRITGLNADLDSVYGELMAYVAAGGNDAPESVNQALHEAVHQIKWTTGDDVYRVIYLVGDAPPHVDYDDDIQYSVTCLDAVKRGIFINTVQCGASPDTTVIWREIAGVADGQYAAIEQSGGSILPPTPHDKELAELSRLLDETRIYYGGVAAKTQQQSKLDQGAKIYAGASIQSIAQRAAFNCSASGMTNFCGHQELVNDYTTGKAKLEELIKGDLPEALQSLSTEQLKLHLDAIASTRKELQEKILRVTQQRQNWLNDELKRGGKDEPVLDRIIYDSIKSQAATKGVIYSAEAPSR